MDGGCLTEVDLFRAFRREMAESESSPALYHVLGCELCREQWERFGLDEQVADGIRSAVVGDARGADEMPGLAEAVELPERLNIPGFRLRGDFIDGGQARVYRATHEASQEEVAIKVFLNTPLNEGGHARFSAELQSLARLRHPNVIPIRSAGEILGHAYYVMPWIEGEGLDEYVRNHELTLAERVDLMVKICAAVDHTHKRGVMHLDLKPSNVLVDSAGEPLVMDFGLARFSAEEDLPSVLGVAGTPAYMAPEQVREGADVDMRADVFMLGLLLFEVLSGQRARQEGIDRGVRGLGLAALPPPSIKSLASIQNRGVKVNRELAAIVAMATATVPERRYYAAQSLLNDLVRYRQGAPVRAMGEGFVYRFRKMSRRHLAGVFGVVCVLLIVTAALLARREIQRMSEQTYHRVWQVTEGRLLASERSLAGAFEELSEVYSRAGDTKQADAYAERAMGLRARIESSRDERPLIGGRSLGD